MTGETAAARFAIALRNVSEKPQAVVAVLRSFSPPEDKRKFLEFVKSRVNGRTGKKKRFHPHAVDRLDAANDAWERAERTLEDCNKHGIRVLPISDPCFPKRLVALQVKGRDPGVSLGGYCPILYCKGAVEALDRDRAVAIIGTREPTEFGRRKAREFGKSLAAGRVVVVSGLARGCDTEAHVGCVEARGAGVAVMAHGLDRVYPPENLDLAGRLVANDGCLVSEYPPGTPPHRRAFGFRDRIQAALADMIVVIETPVRDGTMITVDYARKQGRRIGCLKHPPKFASDARLAGNNHLLTEQSGMTASLRDPAEVLGIFANKVETAVDRTLLF